MLQAANHQDHPSCPWQFVKLKLVCLCAWYCVTMASTTTAEPYLTMEQIKTINANWVCQWCPGKEDNTGTTSGQIEIGAGYVSNDSFKHGTFSGLDEKGAYLVGAVRYRQRDKQGNITATRMNNLGLDSRDAAVTTTWGASTIKLSYDELPSLGLDTARTPYHGESAQVLSVSFPKASNTQGMTPLEPELHNVDIDSKRKTLSFSSRLYQGSDLSYALSLRQINKLGKSTAGLALGPLGDVHAAILATPLDSTTQQAQLSADYVQPHWQGSVRYQLSQFDAEYHTLQWENAFTVPAGINSGQASLAPDNSMQQLSVSGAYMFSAQNTASAMFAIGRQQQNDKFLPYSISGSVANLPRRSLEGEINSFDFSAVWQTRVSAQLDVTANYQQHELDNETDLATYTYVIADSITGSNRANLPYSFRQRKLAVKAQYLDRKDNKFNLGYSHQQYDRTLQAVDSTRENDLWAGFSNSSGGKAWNWSARLQASRRKAGEYGLESSPPLTNALLRKHNLADRDREQMSATLNYTPKPHWQLSLTADFANDDYPDSELGLQESRNTDYTADFDYMFSQKLLFNLGYSHYHIKSSQAGGTTVGPWQGKVDEHFDAFVFVVDYDVLPHKLKLGLDYSYASSEAEYTVSGDAFPQLSTTRQNVQLYGDYQLSKRSTLHLYYQFEDYDEDNWAVDDVNPNTIANVLTLGEGSPAYSIGTFAITYGYHF